MRDALDQVTAELPTFAPMPVAPQRTRRMSHEDRREACDYMPPKQVESCRTCRYVEARCLNPDTPFEREAHRCRNHGFPVLLGAICVDYSGRKA